MFERFTAAAREAVVGAQAQAVRLHHSEIGAEHLLLAVLAQPRTPGARVLASLGVDSATVVTQVPARGDLDEAALRALGIELAEVRRRVEATFGPGSLEAERGRTGWFRRRGRLRHIPFTRAAKRALENALREAIALGHRYIGTEHLVLGLLADEHGVARALITRAGVSPTQDEVRAAVRRELDAAA
jgi:ATP-dependent Clp protease ATP-binding subunit ClpA